MSIFAFLDSNGRCCLGTMRITTGSMIISILFILSRVMFIIDDFVPKETIVLKLFHILYFTITFSTGILSVLGILLYRPQWILPLAILMITYVFVFAIIYFVLFIAYFNDVDNNLRIGYYFIPHEYFEGGSNCETFFTSLSILIAFLISIWCSIVLFDCYDTMKIEAEDSTARTNEETESFSQSS